MSPVRAKRTNDGGLRGKVRAHDPFELIRWLAFSQPDPRKALAELVQNSLDAGARRIRITRVRIKGTPCLRIFDDGEGVIPELERTEALKYIATHIGHSRKRNLSPQERLRLMTQGQYGIGLLGFWSLGERLEMRTVVPGQPACHLILHRDSPQYLIEPLRGRLQLAERWTEVVVVGLHKGCMPVLSARRAADYLASELRGQLLTRRVEMIYEDRLSRGRAQKVVTIRPRRFLGERLALPEAVAVPDHSALRLELYLRPNPTAPVAAGAAGELGGLDVPGEMGETAAGEGEGLVVYAAGTLVAHGFTELAPLGLDHAPWTDPRVIGLVDFPDLTVAPGARHGIVLDAAAEAFAAALAGVEPLIAAALSELDQRRAEELDRTLVRELQRAFRDLLRAKPRYEMPPVARADAQRATAGEPSPAPPGERAAGEPPVPIDRFPPAEQAGAEPAEPLAPEDARPLPDEGATPAQLFPPGPLHHVAIRPASLRVPCGGRRSARCVLLDESGRPIGREASIRWTLESAGHLEPPGATGPEVAVCGGEDPGDGWLRVVAEESGAVAEAEAPVEVVEVLGASRSGEGIPPPNLVPDPGAAWRSRWLDDRWEVNSGHRDFRAVEDRPALKLRYLAALFAKEIVLRSSGDPRLALPLEQLVEVFAFADRRLGLRRTRRKRTEGHEPGGSETTSA